MRRVARCQGCHERGRQLRRPYIFSEIQVLLPSKGKGHDWTNDDGIGKRFPRRVEHAFDVTIQRSHHTYSGEHRWPVKRASGRAGHKSAARHQSQDGPNYRSHGAAWTADPRRRGDRIIAMSGPGTFETCQLPPRMSASGRRPEVSDARGQNGAIDPTATSAVHLRQWF
jgi:hypothetical protein